MPFSKKVAGTCMEDEEKLDELYVQAILLAKVIGGILRDRGKIMLTRKPVFKRKTIVEFMGRMRVTSLDKFDDVTYIATVNFFADRKQREQKKPLGALIIYIGAEYLKTLFKKLDYPLEDDDDDKSLRDACGTFCNIVAGNFKTALVGLGYVNIEMSPFSTFRHEIIDGVAYNPKQKEVFEVDFEIERKKSIVAELTMSPIADAPAS